MTTHEKYLASIMFKSKILELHGNAFEDFFVKVMTLCYTGFRPVKPHGNKGDRKNDGFVPAAGRFFQVYAPELLNPIPSSSAIPKLRKDFLGLKKYWSDFTQVKEYFFVINDKYKGVYPELEKEIALLKEENKEIKIDLFLASNLEQEFSKLSDESIFKVVGLLPNVTKLDYAVLNDAVDFLLDNNVSEQDENLVAPDFDKKIEFNNLSKSVKELLVKGSYQVGSLEKYFSSGKSSVRKLLREVFNNFYKKAKSKYFEYGSISGDLCFFEVLKLALPNESTEAMNAILVLMSFYFENCDIFEKPPK